MNNSKNTVNKRFVYLICLVCFVTNISQIPFFVTRGLSNKLSTPIWAMLCIYCIFRYSEISLHYIRGFFVCTSFFGIYYFVGQLFINAYSDSELVRALMLSVFVLFVGLLVGRELKFQDWDPIITAYTISGLILMIMIYLTYIRGNSLSGTVYLYNSKNSASQILLTTWIFILLKKLDTYSFLKKIFYFVSFAFLTYVLLMLQSRSSILGMPIVVLWVLLSRKSDKKLRRWLVIAVIIIIIALLCNDSFYDFIYQVLTAGRDTSNLNNLTSERFVEWQQFWDRMKDTPFFGHGRDKQETIILTSLLEFGFIGGTMILIIAIYPLVWGLKRKAMIEPLYIIFIAIALTYIQNGITEQLAPFGPCVKCYVLWFMMGTLVSIVQHNLYRREVNETGVC